MPAARLLAVGALALGVANCSSPKVAGGRGGVDPKYGVTASPRLYGENEAIPKGGGRTLVGRPYEIAGKTYVPQENPRGYSREGLASWYGTAFHGRLTANGEVFDRSSIAAAHPTLPLPSYARVTNLANGSSMIVRVNDRGPYHAGRLVDVSEQVAEALDFHRGGTTRVRLDYVGPASLRGSDDRKLLATLRTDGRPAGVPNRQTTLFAQADEGAFGPEPGERPAPVRAEPPRISPRIEPRIEPRVRVAEAETPEPPRPAVRRVASADDEDGPVAASRAPSSPAPLGASSSIPKSSRLPMAHTEAPKAAPLPLVGPPLKIVQAPLPPGRPTGLAGGPGSRIAALAR